MDYISLGWLAFTVRIKFKIMIDHKHTRDFGARVSIFKTI